MELSHDFIIVWVVLKAASSIDDARDTEAVELAHEQARRIHLVFAREFGSLRQRGVENHRVRLGDEQSCWVALAIALDLAGRRVEACLSCIRQRVGPRRIQKRAIVQVEHKHRRVR